MAQPGNFTPILLYGSSTPTNVPLAANLTNSATGSEIAINVADKNLFFKDSGGVVNTVPIRQSSTSSNGWLSNTDWNTFNGKAPATSGTSILYGNGTGGFSNVTIGSGISFAGGTLSATGSGGTVTSVAATVPAFLSIAGSPIITSGTLAITLSGTALPVANGGTGLTTLTAGYIPYGNGTSAFNSSSGLSFDGSNLLIGTTASNPVGSRVNGFSILSTGRVACRSGTAWDWGVSGTSGTQVTFYTDNGSTYVAAGSISSSGSTTLYNATSDYRLKTVIASVSNAGQRIDALEPIEYEFKMGGRTRGFLAHKFAEVYPNSVSGEKDAVDKEGKPIYQGMQASSAEVMADLISEIQSLRKRVATLENK